MEELTTLLAVKDLEIALLKVLLQKDLSQRPGPRYGGQADVDALRTDNAKLVEMNAKLDAEVEVIYEQ